MSEAMKCMTCGGYWLALPEGAHMCKCDDGECEARGKRRIYVASSWRNDYQPAVVELLLADGHLVYDFRNPPDGDKGFHWGHIDHNWQNWTPREYRANLHHSLAEEGFARDMDALKWCDTVIAVQPFGRSASLELGWAAGAGKDTILLLANGEPELMVKMCNHICLDMDEVLEVLK